MSADRTGTSCLMRMDMDGIKYVAETVGTDANRIYDFLVDAGDRHAFMSTEMLERFAFDKSAPKELRAYCAARLSLDPYFGNSGILSDRLADIAYFFSKIQLTTAMWHHPYGYISVKKKMHAGDDPTGVIRMGLIEFGLYISGFHPERVTFKRISGARSSTLEDMHEICTSISMDISPLFVKDGHISLAKYFIECVRALHFVSEMEIFHVRLNDPI
jgi:hypothetical protein